MITNKILIPTEEETDNIFNFQKLTEKSGGKRQKCIVESLRMQGRVREFIKKNEIGRAVVGSNYNGYGYSDHTNYILISAEDGEILLKMLEGKTEKRKKTKTEEEKKTEWSKRLAKLTGITLEEAMIIANDKLFYKEECVYKMMERQFYGNDSMQRQKLINKMMRENPLRRIKDKEHAENILAAHSRHTRTDYDIKLGEAKELASMGIIDHSDVKDYAHSHKKLYYTDTNKED